MAEIRIQDFNDIWLPFCGSAPEDAGGEDWVCKEKSSSESLFGPMTVGFSAENSSSLLDFENQVADLLCATTGTSRARMDIFVGEDDIGRIVSSLARKSERGAFMDFVGRAGPRSDSTMSFVSGVLDFLAEGGQFLIAGGLLAEAHPEKGHWILSGMNAFRAARILNGWLSRSQDGQRDILDGINTIDEGILSGVRDYRGLFYDVRNCSEKYFEGREVGQREKTAYRETVLGWLDAYNHSKRSPAARNFLSQLTPMKFYQIDYSKKDGDILGIRCPFSRPAESREMISNVTPAADSEHPELSRLYHEKLLRRLEKETESLPPIEDWGDYEPWFDVLSSAAMDILGDKAVYNRLADQWEAINGPDPDQEHEAGPARVSLPGMSAEIYLQEDGVVTTLDRTIGGIRYAIQEVRLEDGWNKITMIEGVQDSPSGESRKVEWSRGEDSDRLFARQGEGEEVDIPFEGVPQDNLSAFFQKLFREAFGGE